MNSCVVVAVVVVVVVIVVVVAVAVVVLKQLHTPSSIIQKHLYSENQFLKHYPGVPSSGIT